MLGLTACGGGSGGGGPSVVLLDGVFKDSNVSGLTYESGGKNGVTGTKGEFKYEEGADVKFSIGGVELGSGMGKAVMTPIDLVTDGTLATPEVINKVRFLMMLDKDDDPNNGIEISEKVQTAAADWENIIFTSDDFPTQNVNSIITSASSQDTLGEGMIVEHELPSNEDAVKHFRTTLLCSNAGAFKGSYAGSESGNIVFVVDPTNGEVNGSSYNLENEVSVEIKSTNPISYGVDLVFESAEESAKKFSGIMSSTDTISGSWENSLVATETGTFNAERLGGAADAVNRYTVSFNGNDKGLFTFDVDTGGNVTGTSYSVTTGEESTLTGKLENSILTVVAADGTEIDGKLDEDLDPNTKDLKGLWRNFDEFEQGEFTGSGCLLN